MTKYIAQTSFALATGEHARRGDVIELEDGAAKALYKRKAIGLYLEDGDEMDDTLPKPKPRVKKRTGKPAAPTPLAETIEVDPKAS